MGVYHNDDDNNALSGGTGGSKMAKSSQKLTSLAGDSFGDPQPLRLRDKFGIL